MKLSTVTFLLLAPLSLCGCGLVLEPSERMDAGLDGAGPSLDAGREPDAEAADASPGADAEIPDAAESPDARVLDADLPDTGTVDAGVDDPSRRAVRLRAALSVTCATSDTGEEICWGNNFFGQLGITPIGNNEPPSTVSVIEPWSEVRQLTPGQVNTCAIWGDVAGVICWGQLYQGPTLGWVSGRSPEPVVALMGITQLSQGSLHRCALDTSGRVACWGNNSSGQLGDGTTLTRPSAAGVSSLSNAEEVRAGSGHTCARMVDGSVQCWGNNIWGQLGTPSGPSSSVPVAIPGVHDATSLAAGGDHNCILLSDSTVQCWGNNTEGQCGLPTGTPTSPTSVAGLGNIVQLALGDIHSCALHDSREVLCWGSNRNSRLGLGNETAETSAPTPVPGLTNVVEIAAGGAHTCARHADGGISCWGSNFHFALGSPISDRPEPIRVPGFGP